MANNFANVTDISSMLATANTSVNGWFWIGIMFMVYVVSWISMLSFGATPAFLGASFGTLIAGILLAYMGLVGWGWIAMLVGSMLLVFLWIGYNQQ